MKKQTYMAPTVEVQKIELQRMIAVSGPQVNSNPDDGIDDESKVLSRRNNDMWDDEEEEEY